MFYNKQHNQYVNENAAFTLDGVQYPANWLNNASAKEKADLGLVAVQVVGHPEDDRYYWVSTTLADGVMTYVNTPKDLAMLQKSAVSSVNASAYALLFPSDWMVVKAQETGTEMAADWKAWRQAVRDTAASAVASIEAAQGVPQVQAAMQNLVWPLDPNQPIVEEQV